MTSSAPATGLRHYLPEPSRLWTRQAPLVWPGAAGLWIHLSERSLGAPRSGAVPTVAVEAVDDVFYVPPVDPDQMAGRERLIEQLEAALVPVLVQWRPGEPGGSDGGVLDPLQTLMMDGVDGLRGLETSCTVAVWPLIPGLTDSAEDWRRGLELIARAGVRTVVPVTLELGPAERRRLAEFADEDAYQALFHGAPPDERAFAQLAWQQGLRTMSSRPEAAGGPRSQFNRKAAGELTQTAELWLRLGRPESAGQELLRAARWIERSAQDLRALVREGNLEVLPWLDPNSRQVVEDLAAGRVAKLREELEAEYLGSARQ